MDFNAIIKNIKKDYSSFRKVRLALLGDSSTQLFAKALRGFAFEAAIDLELYEADYDQVNMQIFDENSELYQFDPEFVIIFHCCQKLKKAFYKFPDGGDIDFATAHLSMVEEMYQAISKNKPVKVIYLNFNELDDREFGNYANKTTRSFLYQLRKINYEIMGLSQKHKNMFVCDLAFLSAQAGNSNISDEKFYINADIVFNPDFYVVLSKNIFDIIKSVLGYFNKCLILDADNTLWGGIIGDDGIEKIQLGDYKIGKAFTDLQLFAKKLKERGIILAVCSKNTESIAKEPFEKHPDMVLKLEDISIFLANWETKVDNIRYIKEVLDIGFDSMVFLDDNPFERTMVKENIPGITVPEMPDDPALYLKFLRNENLFETSSFSEADKERTKQYQVEAERREYKKTFNNERDFLKSLEMECLVDSFNSFTIPRVAQLTQRSNQFNLRTIRYTEDEIQQIALSKNHVTLSFVLKDKFGDHGLICAIILEKKENKSLFIDTWIMSCRVLKRDVEKFVLNEIVNVAKENRLTFIQGEYLPTAKNGIVKDLYSSLNFAFNNNCWILDLSEYKPEETFIKKISI